MDSFRDIIIIEELKAKVHQADIIRHITEKGYAGTNPKVLFILELKYQ